MLIIKNDIIINIINVDMVLLLKGVFKLLLNISMIELFAKIVKPSMPDVH